MTEFVRPIHKRIEDLFILDIEALCYLTDHLKHYIPNSLCERKFHAALSSILEEATHGFVVREPFGGREQIVLYGRDSGHGNLRREVAHLVLPKSEVLLTLLEYHFQRPAHRVNPVGLKEVYLTVGGDESVPLSPLVALGEEQTYVTASKDYVDSDVPASQTTAVPAPLLRMVEKTGELVGCVLLTFICVLRLAHLDHTKIVAADVAGSDELDDLGAGKPAVGKHIVEVNLTLDDATDHLYHQSYLALVVLLYALGGVGVLVALLGVACVKLLLLQAMIALLSCLTDDGEVEQYLADAIGNADEHPLKPSIIECVTCEYILPISSVWMPRFG